MEEGRRRVSSGERSCLKLRGSKRKIIEEIDNKPLHCHSESAIHYLWKKIDQVKKKNHS